MNYCDSCETCAHCSKNGCIPVQDTTESTKGLFTSRAFWIAALVMAVFWGLVMAGWPN